MEAAGAPSSKVTVQCTDPSNLLGVFKSRFDSHTPLKNLHWKSPSRPLRSIPSLEVALSQNDGLHNGATPASRRHQIPGLRDTPYVKLYLLRCDDKDTYRESVRKEVKQWIRENTLEKESKSALRNQEYHDAYEWMIVHVVMPNTPAASQPKSSKHLSLDATESTDSLNSKSKWTGKSPSTVYDKLRADFSSSKTSVTRVSQVRITEPGKLSGPLSAAELEEQWADLVSNLKEVILKSFSTRVEQYEEDIRERESQKSLPGWNFCTFFLLKEGLAREFESVGLHDDALGVYDEIELDLDRLVNQGSPSADFESSAGLLPFSRDLTAKLKQVLDAASSDSPSEGTVAVAADLTLADLLASDPKKQPLELRRRHYQELILANQVSALDLRIYLFTRRLDIYLAKSRASVNRHARPKGPEPAVNLAILALLAENALDFITSAARQLRADLSAACGSVLASGEDSVVQTSLIGNMVASWTWMVLTQILAIVKPAIEPYTQALPANGDSLATSTVPALSPTSSISNKANGVSNATHSSVRQDQHLPSGAPQLAAWTARLLLLGRDVLEGLPSCWPWVDEFRKLAFLEAQTGVSHRRGLNFLEEDSRSNKTRHDDDSDTRPVQASLEILEPPALVSAISGQECFRTAFSLLSEAALKLSLLAKTARTSRQILLDNAKLYYSWSKVDRAIASLQTLISMLERDGVVQNQPQALALYAQCLKEAERPSEYADCLLQCLQNPRLRSSESTAQACMNELAGVADSVPSRRVPLKIIAEVNAISRSILPWEGHDGFRVCVSIQSQIAATLSIASPMRLILRPVEKQDPPEITLHSSAPTSVSRTSTEVFFGSTVLASGWFRLSRLEVQIGQVLFFSALDGDEDGAEADHLDTTRLKPGEASSVVLVYPGPGSPRLELFPSPDASLGESRTVSLKIQAMDQDLSRCRLRVRAATAGLRLQLHDAVAQDGNLDLEVMRENEATWLRFPALGRREAVEIVVPFTLENEDEVSISIRCEFNYSTVEEEYTLFESCQAEVLLPISVNVQEIYRASHWFSRFHIGSSTLVPIVILGCEIEEGGEVKARAHNVFDHGAMTFPHMPAQWMVRLEQTRPDSQVRKLQLVVRYKCLDQMILKSLEQAFSDDVAAAGFERYVRPLCKQLLQRTKNAWTEQDLEVAGLTQEMEIWHKDDVEIQTVLGGLDGPGSRRLDAWLDAWHRSRNVIKLDPAKAQTRTLRLTVELPARPPIITAVLAVSRQPGGVARLGQPLVCELLMEKCLPPWLEPEDAEFLFELFAPTDTWLIGGRKKGYLARSEPRTRSQVIIIPQKTGTILLPLVDVRCRRRQHAKAEAEAEWEEVALEMNNLSASTTVTVTPNLKSTTLALGSSDGHATTVGHALASQARGGGGS